MTRTQKLQLEHSPKTVRLSASALDTEIEKRSDTFTAELETLTKRATALETELQAAILASADDEVEIETREGPRSSRAGRPDRARPTSAAIFDGAITEPTFRPTGPRRELQQHFNLHEQLQVPLALLATRRRWRPGTPNLWRDACAGQWKYRRNPTADYRVRIPAVG